MKREVVCGVLFTLLASASGALAQDSSVRAVEPEMGFDDEATPIAILGEEIEPGARAALLAGGGPRVLYYDDWKVFHGEDIALDGGFAYVTDRGEGLKIFDVRDPENPVAAGRVWPRHGRAKRVAVSEGFAYLVEDRFGIRVIDVGNPDDPEPVGEIETPVWPQDVAVSGTYAYVACRREGVRVVDVADPANPAIVATLDTDYAVGVTIAGDLAYVANGRELLILDVRDPTHPFVVGGVETPGSAYEVAVSGAYAYVADGRSGGLQVVDVRNPASPVIVGGLPELGWTSGVVVDGNLAYLTWKSDVMIVDVSDPTRPALVGYSTGVEARNVAVADGFAYAVGYGLTVLDVSEPVVRGRVGSLFTGGIIDASAISGSFAYVNGGEGFHVVDLTDPERPELVGTRSTPATAMHIAVAGELLYVSCWSGFREDPWLLEVFALSDPRNPERLGGLDLPETARQMDVVDDRVYITGADLDGFRPTLRIVDVGNPAEPGLLARTYLLPPPGRMLPLQGTGLGVDVVGDYAYVGLDSPNAFLDGYVSVVDVSDPNHPTLVGSVETWNFNDIIVSEDLAYVVGKYGLDILDVSDPENPARVSHLDVESWSDNLTLDDGFAYMATRDRGLQVVDTREPERPFVVDTRDMPGQARDVEIAGNLAYVVDRLYGLQVIRVNPPLEDVRVVSGDEMAATVPEGFVRGPYHARIVRPDGATVQLDRGFRVCERMAFDARLQPAEMPAPPRIDATSLRWRLALTGDERLFAPEPSHDARLELPGLPAALDTSFVPSTDLARAAIELHLEPELDRCHVRMIGADREALEAMWGAMEVSGGIELPALDDRHYGDLALRLSRNPALAPSIAIPGGEPRIVLRGRAPLVYRYEFADGALVAARAWGAEADLVFRTSGTWDHACREEEEIRFGEALKRACEEFDAVHPELVMDCSR